MNRHHSRTHASCRTFTLIFYHWDSWFGQTEIWFGGFEMLFEGCLCIEPVFEVFVGVSGTIHVDAGDSGEEVVVGGFGHAPDAAEEVGSGSAPPADEGVPVEFAEHGFGIFLGEGPELFV